MALPISTCESSLPALVIIALTDFEPNHQPFERIHWELCVSGYFHASRCDVGNGRYHRIRAAKKEASIANTRAVEHPLEVSKSTLWEILNEKVMHLNLLHRVQALKSDEIHSNV